MNKCNLIICLVIFLLGAFMYWAFFAMHPILAAMLSLLNLAISMLLFLGVKWTIKKTKIVLVLVFNRLKNR